MWAIIAPQLHAGPVRDKHIGDWALAYREAWTPLDSIAVTI
jgi:hypothetical protein